MFHRNIVEQIARFSAVGSVKDQVDARGLARQSREIFHVSRMDIRHDRMNDERRIDLSQTSGGGDGFGHLPMNIGFVEQDLALQIRQFDQIAIDDDDRARAGPRQLLGNHRSQRAAADQQHAR